VDDFDRAEVPLGVRAAWIRPQTRPALGESDPSFEATVAGASEGRRLRSSQRPEWRQRIRRRCGLGLGRKRRSCARCDFGPGRRFTARRIDDRSGRRLPRASAGRERRDEGQERHERQRPNHCFQRAGTRGIAQGRAVRETSTERAPAIADRTGVSRLRTRIGRFERGRVRCDVSSLSKNSFTRLPRDLRPSSPIPSRSKMLCPCSGSIASARGRGSRPHLTQDPHKAILQQAARDLGLRDRGW
jgi:hypothetical protein